MSKEGHKIQIYLYGIDKLEEFILSSPNEGRIWLHYTSNHKQAYLLEVVAQSNKWYFRQNDKCRILGEKKQYVEVEAVKRYEISIHDTRLVLFTFHYQKQHHLYKAYVLCKDMEIKIGRLKLCQISYSHEAVSGHHATLYYEDGSLWIKDELSSNGTYVNGKRITLKKLEMRDVIQILELKILIAYECIYMNEIDELSFQNMVRPYKVKQEFITKQPVHKFQVVYKETYKTFQKKTYEIDKYPPSFDHKQMPLPLMLGPAITMGLSSLSMGFFAMVQALSTKGNLSQSIPTLIMSFSMATGTILWPLLTRLYEKKQANKQNIFRFHSYTKYLNEIQQSIREEMNDFADYLLEQYKPSNICIDKFLTHDFCIPYRNEFTYTLGIGDLSYDVDMEYPKEEFVLQKDPLQIELEKITKQSYKICNIPITKKLNSICYHLIEGEDAYFYMLDLLYQIVLCYGSEILLVVSMNSSDAHKEKIAFLPQIFNKDKSTRYLICHEQDGKYINPILEDEMRTSNQMICFFLFENDFAKKIHISAFLQHERTICFSLHKKINASHHLHSATITVSNGRGTYHSSDEEYAFHYQLSDNKRSICGRLLSNMKDRENQNVGIPHPYHFLDMYECGKVEQLNVWERWQRSDVSTSLEVRIGINEQGEHLYLDAHERYHGPHGLFAGMTGSGKSECLLTYILSLAICFSPEDVSFLLIDYKGGTMAKSCAKLPHIAGIITNLGQDMIQRSLASLHSELSRRQKLFTDTCTTYDIGNMNIDTYRTLCKKHLNLKKLSHLFIIADEFAELKSQQSEFLEQLRQTARIGRSLGVHLLLATQKPAGVIDDQIWSNAHFHLCMKVQSSQDSMDMLKKEDAAYLKKSGECFYQVGVDELYEKGYIAWSQCPYTAQDLYEQKQHDEIAILHTTGAYRMTSHIENTYDKTTETQMSVIVKYIAKIAKHYNLKAESLWKPPIIEPLYVKDFPKCFMVMDDIETQRQHPLIFKDAYLSHCILYGSYAKDRENFINIILFTLLLKETYQIYIFDFDQHTLNKLYQDYVCDVLHEGQREKIESFFYQMRQRKSTVVHKPIVLIVHNYEVFHELYEEKEVELLYLLREGEKQNIFVVVSAGNPNNISYKFQQYFTRTIAFRMNDSHDYQMMFTQPIMCYPKQDYGILLYQERIIGFQTLLCTPDDIASMLTIQTNHASIPTLPKRITFDPLNIEQGLFIGKDVVSKKDVFYQLYSHFSYFICSYQFLVSFLSLCKKQITYLEKDVCFISDSKVIYQNRMINYEQLLRLLQGENSGIFVWEKAYQILDNNVQEYLSNKIYHDPHKHLFFYSMKEYSSYMRYEWISDSFYDAYIVWIGKGIQEYAYIFKSRTIELHDLKTNYAYILEDESCTKIQLWEEALYG